MTSSGTNHWLDGTFRLEKLPMTQDNQDRFWCEECSKNMPDELKTETIRMIERNREAMKKLSKKELEDGIKGILRDLSIGVEKEQ
ncbi:MAG: hypothetical protein A4E53_01524 [Pelotomaculum sp. PtaB.Bin104]|nr:MAG: hypothetical protein A4E53_01524 [Pelotomaculum sp. PtaB.Bin104]